MAMNVTGYDDYYRVKMVNLYNQMHSRTNKASDNVVDIKSGSKTDDKVAEMTSYIGSDPELRRLGLNHWLYNFELLEILNNPSFLLKLEILKKNSAQRTYNEHASLS